MKPTDSIYDVSGARVASRTLGEGPRTLVFLHGIMVNSHVWDPVIEHLVDSCRLVLLDLPLGGHRHPMDPDASGELASHAGRVIQIVEQLQTPVTLVGSDTGGAIAQLAITARPDLFEALVLCPSDAFHNCPPVLLRPLVPLNRVPHFLPLVATLLRRDAVRALLMALVSAKRHSANVTEELMGELTRDRGVQRDLSKLISGLRPDVTRRVVGPLSSYERPVLILWSKKDPLFPVDHASRLAGIFPSAEVHVVEGSRAFISLDQPDWLGEKIRTFIRREPKETR